MKDLTIVIPSKNEELNIQNLLADLSKQKNMDDTKIVLADANSTDSTRKKAIEVAEELSLDLEIINGGIPSVGRNAGADRAETEYVLFIDADIRLKDETLINNVLNLMKSNNLWMATTNTYCDSERFMSRLIYWASSKLQVLSQLAFPYSTGMFMFVNKEAFEKLGRFDETIAYSEDFLLSKLVPRKRFAVYTKSAIYTSDRRLKKMGYFGMAFLFIKTALNARNRKFFLKDHKYWA